jgi:hypothetical protein
VSEVVLNLLCHLDRELHEALKALEAGSVPTAKVEIMKAQSDLFVAKRKLQVWFEGELTTFLEQAHETVEKVLTGTPSTGSN